MCTFNCEVINQPECVVIVCCARLHGVSGGLLLDIRALGLSPFPFIPSVGLSMFCPGGPGVLHLSAPGGPGCVRSGGRWPTGERLGWIPAL